MKLQSGQLQIEKGHFVHAPVIGPLLELLSGLMPLVGEKPEDIITANFTITDGVLETDDLKLAVSAAEVDGRGAINLADNNTNIQAAAKLRGTLGQLTSILGEALAVEGSGPKRTAQRK